MADANTGTGTGGDLGISNKPAPHESEPEAHIIEETVTRPAYPSAPMKPAPDPVVIAPLASPPVEKQTPSLQNTSPLALRPEEGKVTAQIIPPISAAHVAPATSAPETSRAPDLPKGTPLVTNRSPLVAPDLSNREASGYKSQSPGGAPGVLGKEQEAITRILKDIKLPERRESSATAPRPGAEAAKTFDTTLGATPAEKKTPEIPVPETPAVPRAENAENVAPPIVSPLRTLKNDLQELVRTKKMSLVRAVALEQEKRQGQGDALHPEREERSGRAFRVLFSVGVLFMLGGAALFGVYVISQDRSGTTAVQEDTSLLFAEAAVSVPLENQSSSDLKRLLSQGREGGGGTLGSITRVVPTMPAIREQTDDASDPAMRPATTEEFLKALGTRASPDLLRALGSDFFFGFHTVDKNAPLLVIPVSSYERAFAGMLAWEATVSADLAPVFMPIPDQRVGENGLPEKRSFEDLVMRNYDVRALKDDAGNIGLYYSFPTQHMLIIAESPYSFTEILSRLQAGRNL